MSSGMGWPQSPSVDCARSRLEGYAVTMRKRRSARHSLRVVWRALHGMASDTFVNIVQLAEKIVTFFSDVVRYGLASQPIWGLSKDAAWKAMPSPCASRPLED